MMLEDTIECGDIAPYLRGAVSQQRAMAALTVVFIVGWVEVEVAALCSDGWSSNLSQVHPRADAFYQNGPGSRGLPSDHASLPLAACFSSYLADDDAAGLPCLLMHGAANGWLDFPPGHPAAMPGAYLDSLDAISPERAAWLGF